MFQRKTKFKLSQNLKLGIQGPSSQGTFFKVGGIFFLLLSLFLVKNIYKSLNSTDSTRAAQTAQAAQPQVLGAFDQKKTETTPPPKATSYTVQKGDTLFNVAQSQNINWVVIATLNDLKAPYNLKPGTVLKLQ
jgi:LysM repeat protein